MYYNEFLLLFQSVENVKLNTIQQFVEWLQHFSGNIHFFHQKNPLEQLV